jgi:hypothetical protein
MIYQEEGLENVIGFIKRFRIISDKYRCRRKSP